MQHYFAPAVTMCNKDILYIKMEKYGRYINNVLVVGRRNINENIGYKYTLKGNTEEVGIVNIKNFNCFVF